MRARLRLRAKPVSDTDTPTIDPDWPTHCGWCKSKAVAVLRITDWDGRLAGACSKHRKIMQPRLGVILVGAIKDEYYGETEMEKAKRKLIESKEPF